MCEEKVKCLHSILLIVAIADVTMIRGASQIPAGSSEAELYPQNQEPHSSGCAGRCDCGPVRPNCPPGVSLLLDGCGCCKVCARQLSDACDRVHVCDHHKQLYCDDVTRTCKAIPGRDCIVSGRRYGNGEMFAPNCRATCSCIDGAIGCVPTCMTSQRQSPTSLSCLHPRLVKRRGQCCSEWICVDEPLDPQLYTVDHHEVKRNPDNHALVLRGSCLVQTTPWSPCSKSCGFGLSERVTNDNARCTMKKETRLCNLRKCKLSFHNANGCRRNGSNRQRTRIRYSLSGCLSSATYRPRYCSACDGQCCRPTSSKTISVEFRCSGAQGQVFSRDLMWIRKCGCDEGDCVPENDIFGFASRSMNSDISRPPGV